MKKKIIIKINKMGLLQEKRNLDILSWDYSESVEKTFSTSCLVITLRMWKGILNILSSDYSDFVRKAFLTSCLVL